MREIIVLFDKKEEENPKDKCDLCSHAFVGEIVRCKDCKYRNWETKGCNTNPCVEEWGECDFCSRGERKGGNE